MSTTNKQVFRAPDNAAHERISALFLGPRAENADRLMQYFTTVVQGQSNARKSYFPEDADFIPQGVRDSSAYQAKAQEMDDKLGELLVALGKLSIPFYNPRYSAHMTTDVSLSATLGYLSTMFYNPNNVAFEASPFTSQLEHIVGNQLCCLLGFDPCKDSTDKAWGHITCDGSVANLESVWVSRNLKFYPFSLRDALGNELSFVADTFQVTTGTGTTKLLADCSTWELLNLPPRTVLDLPERLIADYKLSSSFVDGVMNQYLVQTTNKDSLMKKWGINDEPFIFVPSTKHYSWPKAAAIAGVGSGNAVNVPVDTLARMNIAELRRLLLDCVAKQRAVYEVVAVVGTTEEGAVDRVTELIQLRDEMLQKGLSFVLHADCAWGGYFCSMLASRSTKDKTKIGDPGDFVPFVGLSLDTQEQLEALGGVDSITIDPHKAGYVPYPAGSLCYNDGRMRYLVTWTAPYINQSTDGESIGVYGVEGSKPGAAPVACYLSHTVTPLSPDGHGQLLGEAMFTCRKFASIWSSMSNNETDFLVVPMNPLPAEQEGDDAVEAQKQFIRDRILAVSNDALVQDADAMALLNQLGSDLNINAFACNFKRKDGTWNDDITEANYLNRRIFERLSVTDPEEDPLSIPFYITSTTFAQADYGVCASQMKTRMKLRGDQDLFVLRNVVMSPFTTTNNFINELAATFQGVLQEEVLIAQERNDPTKTEQLHFLVQGTDKPYFVNMPKFHMAKGRNQFIFTGDLSQQDLSAVQNAFAGVSSGLPKIETSNAMLLSDITDGSSLGATLPDGSAITIANVHIVRNRSLETEDLNSTYPDLMPFYLYGTAQQPHIDHMLLFAPNIQITSGNVTLSSSPQLSANQLAQGVIAIAQNVRERAQQPFPSGATIDSLEIYGNNNKQLVVKIYNDPFPAETTEPIPIDQVIAQGEIATGTITLGDAWYVDSDGLNSEVEKEKYGFDRSGKMSLSLKQRWVKFVDGFDQQLSS